MTGRDELDVLTMLNEVGRVNLGYGSIVLPGMSKSFGDGTLLLADVKGEQSNETWTITATFIERIPVTVNGQSVGAHLVKYADKGFAELVNGQLRNFKDGDGQNVKQMQFLNGSGLKLATGAQPYVLTFRVNIKTDFSESILVMLGVNQ